LVTDAGQAKRCEANVRVVGVLSLLDFGMARLISYIQQMLTQQHFPPLSSLPLKCAGAQVLASEYVTMDHSPNHRRAEGLVNLCKGKTLSLWANLSSWIPYLTEFIQGAEEIIHNSVRIGYPSKLLGKNLLQLCALGLVFHDLLLAGHALAQTPPDA
jgi:hypothetical protein